MDIQEERALNQLYVFYRTGRGYESIPRSQLKPFLLELGETLPALGYSLEDLRLGNEDAKALVINLLGLKLGKENPSELLVQRFEQAGLGGSLQNYKILKEPFTERLSW